ncbi:MAG: undecaprenyl/decaprenyl-phosphate alpha-N-acetylglucosaminyl 1-phosphate transferase [Actinomycetota bacterium]|nr:undecaprenyl/decaprenyl-phosphate alpha-N-acetylglucosaminyl 1-phosphate transferase [Actinomycetota bacterium]
MRPYLTVGLVAFFVSFFTTPLVCRLSTKLGAIDRPNDRKVHAHPTPTLGGIAMFLGIMAAGAIASRLPFFEGIFSQTSQMLGILGGGVVIFLLGMVDDLRDLPAPVKLAGQVFASGMLFLAGVKMQYVLLPSGTFVPLSDDVSFLVTVGWLVAMINAVNLIDGLDGLAAGLVAIAASAFFVYTYQLSVTQGESLAALAAPPPLLAIALVGATLGFLRYNFHPARIFMGDSGSMLLGLVLGGATVVGITNTSFISTLAQTSTPQVFLAYSPLLIPLLVLALPLADAVLAVVRRARRRTSVFHADKEHLHHRLMDLGHGHRQAVVVMYIWSALAAGAGLAFTFFDRNDVIFSLPVLVAAIVLYTLFPLLTKVIQERIAP